jgi:hypothetical protein
MYIFQLSGRAKNGQIAIQGIVLKYKSKESPFFTDIQRLLPFWGIVMNCDTLPTAALRSSPPNCREKVRL